MKRVHTLTEYFRSIEHSFDQALTSRRRRRWVHGLGAILLVLLVSSIVPILPFLLTRAVPWALKTDFLMVRGHRVPLSSLSVWWPTCMLFLLASLALIVWWDTARDEKDKKRWLSDPQMRFARCYSISEEIRKFLTNGQPKHIDDALAHWNILRTMLLQMLRPFAMLYPHSVDVARLEPTHDNDWLEKQRFVLYPEIEALKTHFSWFRLEANAESVIEAFYSLPAKVQDRIRDKKDLEQVGTCFIDLSGYLYSRIPDVPSRQGNESLPEFGDKSLESLVGQLKQLPPYHTETKPATHPARIWKSVAWTASKLSIPFAHPNIFVCFLAWWLLTLALTLVALKTVLRFLPTMTIDSILVSLIVGGPLACAVSAVAISRARKREQATGGE
jgi:hypothetical protein